MWEVLSSAVAVPVGKHLIEAWLGEGLPAEIGGELLSALKGRIKDGRQAREAERQIERLRDAVLGELEGFFKREGQGADVERVARELGATLDAGADAGVLVRGRLDPRTVYRTLHEGRPEAHAHLDEREQGLYDRALLAAATALCAIAEKLPRFQAEAVRAQLEELQALGGKSDEILEGVQKLLKHPLQLAQGFERQYLEAIVTELDEVELLGLERKIDPESQRASLSVAYLSLNARIGIRDEPSRIDFATLLALLPMLGNRLLIEGAAGSGKSTLMRWAAIGSAKGRLGHGPSDDPLAEINDLDSWLRFIDPESSEDHPERLLRPTSAHRDRLLRENWRWRIPFLVPLREVEDSFRPEELPSFVLNTSMQLPEGWVQDAFVEEGKKALLIFDGIDEVPVGRKRDQVLKRIADYAKRFPKAQVLVTSRPEATDRARLKDFVPVELDELNPEQQVAFIAHWHKALALNLDRASDDPAIEALQAALGRELERQPALVRLAVNPLLCGAICALHWMFRRPLVEDAWHGKEVSGFEESVLPGTLWSLTEALTEMLVHQRDVVRKLPGERFGEAYGLSYDTKREILARIAYGMTEDELVSALPRGKAIEHAQAALNALRNPPNVTAEQLLQALIERSGVLRGSGADSVEFVHNTLKAFLAAKFYLGLGAPRGLVRRIREAGAEEVASGLDETALFAAASPDHPAYTQALIKALLESRKKKTRRRLSILAVRAETVAMSKLEEETHERLRAIVPELLPPRSFEEARQLAALGNEAVPHLVWRPEVEPAWNAASVRCLKLIGTAEARAAIEGFLETDQLPVAEEMVGHVHPLRIRVVVEACQDFRTWMEVSPDIEGAIHDIAPLSDRKELKELYLNGTAITDRGLDAIAKLQALQRLFLAGTAITDQGVEAVAKLQGLQTLVLDGTQVTDRGLDALAKLQGLQTLSLGSTAISDQGLDAIAKLQGLQMLFLGGTRINRDHPVLAALRERGCEVMI